MSTQEVHHFLIVCSLVSDLYCPGYNPPQPLAKDSNLALTASRYKIDTAKLSTAVREGLSTSVKGTTRKKSKATRTKSK